MDGSDAPSIYVYASYDIVIAGTINTGRGGDGLPESDVAGPGEGAGAGGENGGGGGAIELMSTNGNIELNLICFACFWRRGNWRFCNSCRRPSHGYQLWRASVGKRRRRWGRWQVETLCPPRKHYIEFAYDPPDRCGRPGRRSSRYRWRRIDRSRRAGSGTGYGGDGGRGGELDLGGGGDVVLELGLETHAGDGGQGGIATGKGGDGSSEYPGAASYASGGAGGEGGLRHSR